jgi:DnaJ-class molecular chaperone
VSFVDCPRCYGEGTIYWNPSSNGDPQMEASAVCPDCYGTGEREITVAPTDRVDMDLEDAA